MPQEKSAFDKFAKNIYLTICSLSLISASLVIFMLAICIKLAGDLRILYDSQYEAPYLHAAPVEITNILTQESIRFLKRGRITNYTLLEYEWSAPPDHAKPVEHMHPGQVETVVVLHGSVRVYMDGHEYRYKQGDTFVIPPKVVHMYRNAAQETAVLQVQMQPAAQQETFLETYFGLVNDFKTDHRGIPKDYLQLAPLSYELDSTYLAPVSATQKMMFAIAMPFAKMYGFRACYPQYSDHCALQ